MTFPEGWQIKPDMVIEMPKPFHVKATGTINYQNIKVHVNFPEDMWVVAAEMRAGNPKVVHHMRAIVTPPGATWMAHAVYGEAYEEGSEAMTGAKEGTDLLGKYNPGLGAQHFDATALRSSFQKVPTSYSISTTRPSGPSRTTSPRLAWYSQRTRPRSAIGCRPALRLRSIL